MPVIAGLPAIMEKFYAEIGLKSKGRGKKTPQKIPKSQKKFCLNGNSIIKKSTVPKEGSFQQPETALKQQAERQK